jgi:hypothetical protein
LHRVGTLMVLMTEGLFGEVLTFFRRCPPSMSFPQAAALQQ